MIQRRWSQKVLGPISSSVSGHIQFLLYTIRQKEYVPADFTGMKDTADAADHLGAAKAIAQGALEGHTEEHPVYWLHTSGAGIFSFLDTETKVYGEKGEKIYDDVQDIKEIVNFPDHAFHRDVDKAVFEAGSVRPGVLKTAIISPVTVYGKLQ